MHYDIKYRGVRVFGLVDGSGSAINSICFDKTLLCARRQLCKLISLRLGATAQSEIFNIHCADGSRCHPMCLVVDDIVGVSSHRRIGCGCRIIIGCRIYSQRLLEKAYIHGELGKYWRSHVCALCRSERMERQTAHRMPFMHIHCGVVLEPQCIFSKHLLVINSILFYKGVPVFTDVLSRNHITRS